MAAHIPANKSGHVVVVCDGDFKNPQWHIDDTSIATVTPGPTAPASQFEATIIRTPGGPLNTLTNIRFAADKLDDSATENTIAEFQFDSAPGNSILSITITVNP